jgi:hypothetical protein
MSIRPKLMTGADLDNTATAVAHILGCRERYGTLDQGTERELEKLLDEVAAEQIARRTIAASKEPVGPSRD